MQTAYLALGSNLGDRLENLQFAVRELEGRGVRVAQKSKIYSSQSVGTGGEGDFLNAAIRVETDLSPLELLEVCQQIEIESGREAADFGGHRFGARTLDIDIVAYGAEKSDLINLELPHPRALERNFVIRPLLDVLPGGWLEETELNF
jgi:2-amino-4-hydroxy-6-hydroxymethyldihydropteridine diphosphokinase